MRFVVAGAERYIVSRYHGLTSLAVDLCVERCSSASFIVSSSFLILSFASQGQILQDPSESKTIQHSLSAANRRIEPQNTTYEVRKGK